MLKNTFPLPSKEEFEELEDNDRMRTGIQSDLTMTQGRRYNDGRHGKLNINKDIIPYDQTRVKLRSPINKIDYINATFIQTSHEVVYDDLYEFLASSKINFILTQDPTQDTQHHFYQMVFEQQADVIVHVGSDRNFLQWNTLSYGHVELELADRINLEENIMREKINIFIKADPLIHSHSVTVYHFSAWPSHDQFEEADCNNILTLISLIQRDIGKPTKKFTIVSHDASGGVTGASSFIALFQLQQELSTKLKVRNQELMDNSQESEIEFINIFDKVNELRKRRAHMISTFSNYQFLLKTLAYYARNKSKFDKILTTVDTSAKQKDSTQNNPNTTGQALTPEVEYVYSDDIFDVPLYQNEPNEEETSNSDIYVN